MTMTEDQRKSEASRLAAQLLLDAQWGAGAVLARWNHAGKPAETARARPARRFVREWEQAETSADFPLAA